MPMFLRTPSRAVTPVRSPIRTRIRSHHLKPIDYTFGIADINAYSSESEEYVPTKRVQTQKTKRKRGRPKKDSLARAARRSHAQNELSASISPDFNKQMPNLDNRESCQDGFMPQNASISSPVYVNVTGLTINNYFVQRPTLTRYDQTDSSQFQCAPSPTPNRSEPVVVTAADEESDDDVEIVSSWTLPPKKRERIEVELERALQVKLLDDVPELKALFDRIENTNPTGVEPFLEIVKPELKQENLI